MAIYHLTTKPLSRSSGRSATAAAAYRAGVKITDERTGLTHDYTNRTGVAMALAFDKDFNALDRNEMWNLAEKAEKRKDARTAREYIVAIPAELIPNDEHDQQYPNTNKGAMLAIEFGQRIAERYGVAVDVAIHAPDKEGDNRNWHAHIMTTTRQLIHTDDGIELGDKALIELSNRKLATLDKPKTQQQVKDIRALWADLANNALADNGHSERIDHRSHAERGLVQQPTIKLGWKASEMERRGIATDRGDMLRTIQQNNSALAELQLEIVADRQRLIPSPYYDPILQRKIITETEDELDDTAEQLLEQERRSALEKRDIERMQTLMVDNVDMQEWRDMALDSIDPATAESYKLAKKAQADSAQYYKNTSLVTTGQAETAPPDPVVTNDSGNVYDVTSIDKQGKHRHRP